MNLRVDLILDTEQRSASLINAKSILRVSAIIVPVIVALIIAGFVFTMWQLKIDRDSLKKAVQVEEPKKLVSLRVRTDLANNKAVLDELEGWKKSRVEWADQLLGVQKQIPDKIQLTTLTMSSDLKPTNSLPARLYMMSLSGQAVGDTAQALVINLHNILTQSSAVSNAVATNAFNVTRFGGLDNPTDDNKNDRIFQIDCSYKPGMFQ